MSDIEELLRTLGSHTDQVDPRPPSLARRAGAKRQRRRRVAWGSLLVLACIAASGGIVTLIDRASPPIIAPTPPPSAPSSSIVPLYQVGPGISYGQPLTANPPQTTIRQNRAFATWHQAESTLVIAAIDLTTGEQAWRHQEEASASWITMTGSDEMLLGIYRMNDAASTEQTVIAFDTGSGADLWRFTFSRELFVFGNTVVVEKQQSLIGLDIRTGQEQWTVEIGPSADRFLAPMRSSADTDNPSARRAAGGTDHRLVILSLDGRVRMVNTDTGTVTLDTTIALSGRLVSLDAADGTAIIADQSEVRLISSQGTSIGYTAKDGRQLLRASPCGAGRLCVAEQVQNDYDVTVIDVASKQPQWQQRGRSLPFVSTSSGYYFISDSQELRVFDSRGSRLASFNTAGDTPLIMTPELVLHMLGEVRSDRFAPTAFAVGSLTSASSTPIGQLNVFAFGCTPNTTTLVCPTETGVRVWRFR